MLVGGSLRRCQQEQPEVRQSLFSSSEPNNNANYLEKVATAEKNGQPERALPHIADAGMIGRALFVCDRDELRMQALVRSKANSATMRPRVSLAIFTRMLVSSLRRTKRSSATLFSRGGRSKTVCRLRLPSLRVARMAFTANNTLFLDSQVLISVHMNLSTLTIQSNQTQARCQQAIGKRPLRAGQAHHRSCGQ
jgi:hypothetical protein